MHSACVCPYQLVFSNVPLTTVYLRYNEIYYALHTAYKAYDMHSTGEVHMPRL